MSGYWVAHRPGWGRIFDAVDFCMHVGRICPEKRLAPAVTLDKGTKLIYVLRHLTYTDQNFYHFDNAILNIEIFLHSQYSVLVEMWK